MPLKSSQEARAFFRASTYTVIGNGRTTLFWTDNWINGESVQTMAPALVALVPRRVIKTQTVAEALTNGNWIQQITGGLSLPAIAEYLNIRNAIRDVQLGDAADQVLWRWTSDGKFSVQSACSALHLTSHPTPGCDLIWETWALLRVKLFLWLALRRRH